MIEYNEYPLDRHALEYSARVNGTTPEAVSIAVCAYERITREFPEERPAKRLGELLECDGYHAIELVTDYVLYGAEWMKTA